VSIGKYREVLYPDVKVIIAAHPDFEPFVIEGVKIQAGEIKVVNFVMMPPDFALLIGAEILYAPKHRGFIGKGKERPLKINL